MKINIGPHKNWFGPYQLADFLCFWVKKEKDEYGIFSKPDWVHDFGEYLAHGSSRDTNHKTLIYKILCWVDSKKKRKVKIQIHPYDTWNLDRTLAMIIHPLLLQLKQNKHGSPFVYDDDVPEELKSTSAPPKENEWDPDENFFKRWEWVLDKMIWSFSQLLPDCDYESQFMSGEPSKFVFKKTDNGYSILEKNNETFEIDTEGLEEHEQKINEGLVLFGKYYRGLWD